MTPYQTEIVRQIRVYRGLVSGALTSGCAEHKEIIADALLAFPEGGPAAATLNDERAALLARVRSWVRGGREPITGIGEEAQDAIDRLYLAGKSPFPPDHDPIVTLCHACEHGPIAADMMKQGYGLGRVLFGSEPECAALRALAKERA